MLLYTSTRYYVHQGIHVICVPRVPPSTYQGTRVHVICMCTHVCSTSYTSEGSNGVGFRVGFCGTTPTTFCVAQLQLQLFQGSLIIYFHACVIIHRVLLLVVHGLRFECGHFVVCAAVRNLFQFLSFYNSSVGSIGRYVFSQSINDMFFVVAWSFVVCFTPLCFVCCYPTMPPHTGPTHTHTHTHTHTWYMTKVFGMMNRARITIRDTCVAQVICPHFRSSAFKTTFG